MTAPLVSQAARFDAEGFELLKTDLRSLGQLLGSGSTIYLSGTDRVCIPVSGKARFFCVCDTTTVSTGIAYHILSLLRSGQSETGISLDTRTVELAQYGLNYLGEVTVGRGNFCKLNIAVTGAPVPLLSSANFALFCQLTPSVE